VALDRFCQQLSVASGTAQKAGSRANEERRAHTTAQVAVGIGRGGLIEQLALPLKLAPEHGQE
jgi:hypothetical protein